MTHGDITPIHPNPLFLYQTTPPITTIPCTILLHFDSEGIDERGFVDSLDFIPPHFRTRSQESAFPRDASEVFYRFNIEVREYMIDHFIGEEDYRHRQRIVLFLKYPIDRGGMSGVQQRRQWTRSVGLWFRVMYRVVLFVIWSCLDGPLE